MKLEEFIYRLSEMLSDQNKTFSVQKKESAESPDNSQLFIVVNEYINQKNVDVVLNLEDLYHHCDRNPQKGFLTIKSIVKTEVAIRNYSKRHFAIYLEKKERKSSDSDKLVCKTFRGMNVCARIIHTETHGGCILDVEKETLNTYGVSKEQLYADALENSAFMFPYQVKDGFAEDLYDLKKFLRGQLKEDLSSEAKTKESEETELHIEDIEDSESARELYGQLVRQMTQGYIGYGINKRYRVSDQEHIVGAGVVMYPGILKKIAAKIEDSFFLTMQYQDALYIYPVEENRDKQGNSLTSEQIMDFEKNASFEAFKRSIEKSNSDYLNGKVYFYDKNTNKLKEITKTKELKHE